MKKQLLRWLVQAKRDQCAICGERDPVVLQLHHRDPKQKKFNLASVSGRTETAIFAELDKVVALCCNCHLKLHAGKERLPDGENAGSGEP